MDLGRFYNEGYQVIPKLFSEETLLPIDRFLTSQMDVSLETLRPFLDFDEHVGMGGAVSSAFSSREDLIKLPHDVRNVLCGHFHLEARLSKVLWRILDEKGLHDILKRLFNHSNPRMHLPPAARFVLPGNHNAAVPAHQDFSYNQHVNNLVTLWVPLVEITDHCGGVNVFPGTNQSVSRNREKENLFWLPGILTEQFKKVHCKMKVGDALLLNQFIVHESAPNESDRVRISVDYRFFDGEDKSTKHCLDIKNREIITPQLVES